MLKQRFGATVVDAIDHSSYEGANIIADFNQPLPPSLAGCYDTVLDLGCTEHIFDVAQSFRNLAQLCRPGGRILHAVPSDGCCGHGFYQFSPELFFSRYALGRGFSDTEVFLADMCEPLAWYKVHPPTDGQRINIRSEGEVYVLVLTRRHGEPEVGVQQSDYEFIWSRSKEGQPMPPPVPSLLTAMREHLSPWPWAMRLLTRVDARLAPAGARPLARHPALERVRLPQL